jgi:hypothetical protein
MQQPNHSTFALALADAMVKKRFFKDYRISKFSEYLDLVDQRATALLSPKAARALLQRAGGRQRREARLQIDGSGVVTISIPMRDPRSGKTLWAITELCTWLDVVEAGANGAWLISYNSATSTRPYVRTNPPLGNANSTTLANITRIIVNAKARQHARTLDGNSLNLRRFNIYVVGQPKDDGKRGKAKRDTRSQMQEHQAMRERLAEKRRVSQAVTQGTIPEAVMAPKKWVAAAMAKFGLNRTGFAGGSNF